MLMDTERRILIIERKKGDGEWRLTAFKALTASSHTLMPRDSNTSMQPRYWGREDQRRTWGMTQVAFFAMQTMEFQAWLPRSKGGVHSPGLGSCRYHSAPCGHLLPRETSWSSPAQSLSVYESSAFVSVCPWLPQAAASVTWQMLLNYLQKDKSVQ